MTSASATVTNGFFGVEWRDDGFFSARRDNYLVVKGVASDFEVIAEVLKRSGVLRTSRSMYSARPNGEVEDFNWTRDAAHAAGDVDVELAYQLGAGRPDGIESQLQAIGSELPGTRDELENLARARASELNRHAPLVGEQRVFIPPFDESDRGAHGVQGSAFRGWGLWTSWVDPQLLVHTPSREWNDISRLPRRGTVVNVAEWLRVAAQSLDGVEQWLRKMFGQDPMLLRPLPGPAGPVYEVVTDEHRAHAASIWGLPWVLARVARPSSNADRCRAERRPLTALGWVASARASAGGRSR